MALTSRCPNCGRISRMSAAGCPFCARRKRMPDSYRHAWTLLRIAALILLVWYVAHRFGQMGE